MNLQDIITKLPKSTDLIYALEQEILKYRNILSKL